MTTPLPVVQCCAPLGAPQLSEDEAGELERVFKALADRHRVKILNRLLSAGGEAVCVCDFEDMLGLKQSTVSYHLKQLLDAGIIAREKRGSFAYFSVTPGALERVGGLLERPPRRSRPDRRAGAVVCGSTRRRARRARRARSGSSGPPRCASMRRPRCTRDFIPDVDNPSAAAACSWVSSPRSVSPSAVR